MKIHYDLIGTVPAVEFLKAPGALDELILRYEQGKPLRKAEFGLMSPTDIKLYVAEAFKDPKSVQRMADGVAIELAAQHFYGLKGEDFSTMAELIDAINSIEQENKFK